MKKSLSKSRKLELDRDLKYNFYNLLFQEIKKFPDHSVFYFYRRRVCNLPQKNLKNWCEFHEIELHFIQPGKPTQNTLIERFNRTFRKEFLDIYLFENLQQMRNYAEIWMWKYNNNERPHSSLMYLTPRDFLLKYGKIKEHN